MLFSLSTSNVVLATGNLNIKDFFSTNILVNSSVQPLALNDDFVPCYENLISTYSRLSSQEILPVDNDMSIDAFIKFYDISDCLETNFDEQSTRTPNNTLNEVTRTPNHTLNEVTRTPNLALHKWQQTLPSRAEKETESSSNTLYPNFCISNNECRNLTDEKDRIDDYPLESLSDQDKACKIEIDEEEKKEESFSTTQKQLSEHTAPDKTMKGGSIKNNISFKAYMFENNRRELMERLVHDKKEDVTKFLETYNEFVFTNNGIVKNPALEKSTPTKTYIVSRFFIHGKHFLRNTCKESVANNFKRNRLMQNFTVYYIKNGLQDSLKAIKERDDLLDSLYLSYMCEEEPFSFIKGGNVSLKTYSKLCNDTENREKRLVYSLLFYKSLSVFQRFFKIHTYSKRSVFYNLIIYTSTIINIKDVSNFNYRDRYRKEIERIYNEYMLPLETDHLRLLYMIARFNATKELEKTFSCGLISRKYDKQIAFYHFKDLLYILYNMDKIKIIFQSIYYNLLLDFPGSLKFYSMVVKRFIMNTIILVAYTRKIEFDINDYQKIYKVWILIIENALKYLNETIPLEKRLENIIDDVFIVLEKNNQ